jgi:hypothetical protein
MNFCYKKIIFGRSEIEVIFCSCINKSRIFKAAALRRVNFTAHIFKAAA